MIAELEPPPRKSEPLPERRRPPTSRIAIWGPLLAVLALAIALVFGIWRHVQSVREQEDFKKKTSEVSAEFIVAKRDPKPQELTLPGNFVAVEEAMLYARSAGYIKRYLVDIGDNVQAGQLLAVIETPEVEQQLAQSLQTARQSEANFEIARVTAQRWKELVDRRVVSRQENDEKQAAFQAAVAALAAARADVARLEQLQAFSQVTAPFAGKITSRKIDIGALVSSGSGTAGTALFGLARTDPVDMFVSVPQSSAPLIRDGMAAKIDVQELHGRDFEGFVIRNAGALDPQSRTLLTKVEIPNHDGVLLAGMFAQVKFTLVDEKAPLLIPSSAFVFRSTGSQIATLGKSNKIHWQNISVGRDLGTRIEVTEGLEENTRLVVNPTDDLREGLAVQPKEAEEKPDAEASKASGAK